ncbi:MAG: F0F1 ATP synthase subunit gamma [Rhodobacteraceae bacterium]|nr:F0F1 ATP synthase subunit gamma [Paracoccaceae bacterium]
MSQRREIEARLALYGDLAGILGAMRSFALAELHRVSRREEAQQQVVRVLGQSLQEVSPFLPPQEPAAADVWLLLGSVRGFCGSFNQDIVRAWRGVADARQAVIVVGQRLQATMAEELRTVPVAGADGGLDAAAAIDRILAAITLTRRRVGPASGLIACVHDEDGVRRQRLLPLPVTTAGAALPPLTNEPPATVAAGVAEHFLFHQLLALLLRSIRVENRQRLMQMENALHHLEQGSDELARQRNRLRQEEIVEEIEVITGIRGGMH